VEVHEPAGLELGDLRVRDPHGLAPRTLAGPGVSCNEEVFGSSPKAGLGELPGCSAYLPQRPALARCSTGTKRVPSSREHAGSALLPVPARRRPARPARVRRERKSASPIEPQAAEFDRKLVEFIKHK
jgi:hypothetical protein